MNRKLLCTGFLLGSVFLFPVRSLSAATSITFDDLRDNGDGTFIADGYEGLNWSNFAVLDTPLYRPNPSGYQNGTASGSNVAFNNGGSEAIISMNSGGDFALTSGDFTAAWNDGLQITVQGLNRGVVLDTTTFTVDSTGPTFETFDWSGIDQLIFGSAGGTSHGYGQIGEQFVLDNLTIGETSPVPEPDACLLLGTVGALLLPVVRKRYLANANS